jgi:regulator of protease activity HflC (stomatin/prohibitin superfamily)
VGKLILCSMLCLSALCFGGQAFADDWDMPDAMAAAQAAREADQDAPAKADAPAPARDEAQPKGSNAPADHVSLDDKAPQRTPPVHSGEAPSNILGPLWGVPADAPVMRDIDPEAEKQYAVNGEGRLVPRSGTDEEQMKAAAEADKERERQEAKAAKEKQRAEEKAERERRRAEEKEQRERDREAAKAGKDRPHDDEKQAEPAAEPAPAAADKTAEVKGAAAGRVDERETSTTGCRSTPEQQGW